MAAALRKSTHSIMANSGFGPVVIRRGSTIIEVPQSQIVKSSGTVKKSALKLLMQNITLDAAIQLAEKGLIITFDADTAVGAVSC